MPLSKQTKKNLENLRDQLLEVIKKGLPQNPNSVNSQIMQRVAGSLFGIFADAVANAEKFDQLPNEILDNLRVIMDRFEEHETVYILAHELYFELEERRKKANLLECYSIVKCYSAYLNRASLKPAKIAETLKKQHEWQLKIIDVFKTTEKKHLTQPRCFDFGLFLLNETGRKNPFYEGIHNNLQNAEKLFKKITEKNSLHLRAFGLAMINFHRGKIDEALKLLQEIEVSELPSNVSPYYLLGRCYLAKQETQKALYAFKLGAQAQDFDCGFQFAVMLCDLGQAQEGGKMLRGIADRDGDAAMKYYEYCRDGKIPNEDALSARTYLEKAKNTGHPQAIYEIGLLHENEENYIDAIECYEVAKLFNHVAAIKRLAEIYKCKPSVANVAIANMHYELAAAKNDVASRIYVADGLWHGVNGFQQNKVEAAMHYDLAINTLLENLKDPTKTSEDLATIHYQLATIFGNDYKNRLQDALRECESALKLKSPFAGMLKRRLFHQLQKTRQRDATLTKWDNSDDEQEISQTRTLTLDDLIERAYQLQSNGKHAGAITLWKQIREQHFTPLIRIKCTYAIAFNYLLWSKCDDAPVNALSIAQRKIEKVLGLILIALHHPNTTALEKDELEFWHQTVLSEAEQFKLCNTEEYQLKEEVETVEDLHPITPPASQTIKLNYEKDIHFKKTKAEIKLSPAAAYVHKTLKSAGHRALVVGGAVRDHFSNQTPKDFDFITRCPLISVAALFPGKAKIVGKKYPIVIITHDGEKIEIGHYQSLIQDYQSRDFTVNCLYYDIDNQEIISINDSELDIKNKCIRTIVTAVESFENYPIRMLRAINLRSKTQYKFDLMTKKALTSKMEYIKKENSDRLMNEILKLFINPNNTKNIYYLNKYKILGMLLPLSTAPLTNVKHPYYALMQSALKEASTPGSNMDPCLLLAIILWPALEATLKNRKKSADELEKAMKNVLDIQCKNLLLPEVYYNKIRCLWRMYLMMMNIYRGTPALDSMRYNHYLLADKFFSMLNHRHFYLAARNIHNQNEATLFNFKSPMKRLIHAINSNNYDEVKKIVAKQLPPLTTANNTCWLHLAAASGNIKIMELFKTQEFITAVDDTLQPPMHYAATMGHLSAIQWLLNAGGAIEAINIKGENILHIAARHGHLQIVEYILKYHRDLLQQTSSKGESALHSAVIGRQYHIVKLLSQNLDTEAVNSDNKRAVDLAVNDEKYQDLPTIINASKSKVEIPEHVPCKVLKKCHLRFLSGLNAVTTARLERHQAKRSNP